MMTAIVQYYIQSAHLLYDRLQEMLIGLRTYSHLSSFAIQLRALGIDVNSEDNRIVAKVFSPHLKTAAFTHSNLKKSYFPSSKRGEIPIIQRNVMVPLGDDIVSIINEQLK